MKTLSISIYVSLTMVLALPCASVAYVLTGPHILKLVAVNMGHAKKGLVVEQTLYMYADAKAENQTQDYKFHETVLYKFPKRFRSDIWTDDLQQIHIFAFGLALTIVDSKLTSTSETIYDLYKDIFLNRSRHSLEDLVAKEGIDASISSLGRIMGKIAFVIGAHYPDETVSQLWVDKKTFMPIRWLIVSQGDMGTPEDQELFEIRYYLWQPVGKTQYPRRIEFFKNNKLTRMILVKSVKTDGSAPDTLFDIAQLKKRYHDATLDHSNEPAEDSNELQNLIDDFKNRLPSQ